MPTHVRFRINKITGEVEEFLVDDQDRTLPEEEHDRIAAEVARTVTRHPLVHEVTTPPPAGDRVQPPDRVPDDEKERERPGDEPLREGDA
jgi:hypothetical protein